MTGFEWQVKIKVNANVYEPIAKEIANCRTRFLKNSHSSPLNTIQKDACDQTNSEIGHKVTAPC